MKVFTNTNFATGKAGAEIEENVIVGLSPDTGDVIQAVATTVPIGVTHNYAADAGQPVTVIPIGAGFARVKAGAAFTVADIGAIVGSDSTGRVVKSPVNPVGILAGLSADVEGATTAATGDEVVVLLNGGVAADPASATVGTVTFAAKDGEEVGVTGVSISLTVSGNTVTGTTASTGEKSFEFVAGTYTWTATKSGSTITPASGSATITAGQTTTVELAVTGA